VSTEKALTDGDRTASAQANQQESIFDVRLLLGELWRWKWAVILATLIGAAVGVNDARKYSPTYMAQMTVSSIKETNMSQSAGGGRLMGAAQSLGFVLGGSATSPSFAHFKQALGSRDFANVLQKKHGFMQIIFKDSWDLTKKTWIQPKIDEDSIRWKIRRYFHLNSPQVPEIGDLADYIGSAVLVEAIQDSTFFSISVVHGDRDFALYLLDLVYKEADAFLNQRKQVKRERNKKYVREQLQRTELAEIRAVLLGIMMKLEQSTMLASSHPPYTMTVLEHPWVTKQPKEPRLTKIIAVPAAVGFILVLAFATMIVAFRME